jgi:hypothetical protein
MWRNNGFWTSHTKWTPSAHIAVSQLITQK